MAEIPFTSDHVRIIHDIVKIAVDDITFLRRLGDPAIAKAMLEKKLTPADLAILNQFEPVIFKSIESTGYCIVPPQGEKAMVVVVSPRPTAIRPECVNDWPQGSSPEPKAPPGSGCPP